MRALQISAYGSDPLNVLELVDIPEPREPGADEVLIDVELAPLNKHDLLFIRGAFGGPPAPTVVGNEGFGRVAAVGPDVATLRSATTC
jgi:NADPH:quinone reductase-like Zn-dependent oxidoreductase